MAYKEYATQEVVATATGHMTGFVPDDFYNLLHMSLWFIPEANDLTFDATIIVMAADSGTIDGVGELYSTHDTTPGTLYNLADIVQDHHYMLDITDQDPGMSAGDMVGVSLASGAGNETIQMMGLKLRYKRRYPLMSGLSAIAEEFWPCEKADVQV